MSKSNTVGFEHNPIPVGTIFQYAGAILPPTWVLCDGSTLNVADYPELYNVIGSIYGSGSGTFNVPNLSTGQVLAGSTACSNTTVAENTSYGAITGSSIPPLTNFDIPSFTATVSTAPTFGALLIQNFTTPDAGVAGFPCYNTYGNPSSRQYTEVSGTTKDTVYLAMLNSGSPATTFNSPTITVNYKTPSSTAAPISPINISITGSTDFSTVRFTHIIKAKYT